MNDIAQFFGVFIKSTDHRPTDHRPLTHRPTDQLNTYQPTHRTNNHRPNRQDSISKTWSMKNIQSTERKQLHRCKTILRSIVYLMNSFRKSLSLVFFKRKLLFCKRDTKDLIIFAFYILNRTNCFTPSQIFTVYFYVWKFQSDQMFFNILVTFCMWVNLINLANQQIKG